MVVKSLEHSEEILTAAPELTEDSVVNRYVHLYTPHSTSLLHISHLLYNRVRSVKIDGSEYRKSTVVLSSFEEGLPVFAEVVDIIATPLQECLFIMHPLVADYFDRHFHAYHVITYNDHTLVSRYCQLHDHQVLHTNRIHSTVDHSLYVCVKYHVFE